MADNDFMKLPAVQAVLPEVDALEVFAANYKVTNAEQFLASADELKRVKAAQKQLEAARTSITDPLNAALKAANNFFRLPGDRLARIERAVKNALGIYADEQERLRRQEQERAETAAKKERDRIEARAAAAAAQGKSDKAEQLQERANAVVAPVIQREAPKVTGLSSGDTWKFDVTDPALVPREYLSVDMVKIGAVVRAMKGETKIAGVTVRRERRFASGSV